MKPRKKHPKIAPKAIARKKHPKVKLTSGQRGPRGAAALGFDVSMSSMAGAGLAWDATLKRWVGPKFVMRRWSKEDHYFDRLEMAANSYELVLDLMAELGVMLSHDEIWIAQEEPFPLNMAGQMQSSFLKQQSEMSGAFLGGLLRYGYKQIHQISHLNWRGVIADDLGITTHHSKWKDPALCEIYNCHPDNSGKFRAKQWAMEGEYEVPDWPDIIETKKFGKIPRPEGSKARAIQPDDRYDALAMCEFMRLEMFDMEVFDALGVS